MKLIEGKTCVSRSSPLFGPGAGHLGSEVSATNIVVKTCTTGEFAVSVSSQAQLCRRNIHFQDLFIFTARPFLLIIAVIRVALGSERVSLAFTLVVAANILPTFLSSLISVEGRSLKILAAQ